MANEFKIRKGLIVAGASGGTVVDVQGSQGQLFSVTDDLSGSIFAVSDISGVPIMDINSDGTSYFDGNVGIGTTSPQEKLHVYNAGTARVEVEGTTGPAAFKATNSQGSFGWYIPSNANNFRLWNFGTSADLLTVDASGNATFSGNVTATKLISTGGVLDLDDNGDADGVINARASLTLNIDSDANSTGEVFRINSNTTGVNTNNLLSITETGNATFAGTISSGAIAALAKGGEFGSTGYYVNSTFKDVADNCGVILGHNDTANGIGVIAGVNELAFLTYGSDWTQALLLDSSQNATFAGKVGIGITTTPSDELEIGNLSNYTGLTLKGTGASRPALTFKNVNQSLLGAIYGTEGRAMTFEAGGDGTTGVVAMTIDSSGDVGIGTDSPNQDGFGSATTVLSIKAKTSGGSANTELIGLGNNDNDQVGMLGFMSQSATSPLATIRALRHTSDTSGKLTFDTAGSERMRINYDGNVGIGTTDPATVVDITKVTPSVTTFYPYLQLSQRGTVANSKTGISFRNTEYNWDLGKIATERQGSSNSFDMVLYSANSGAYNEGLRIDHLGNIGIGTTSPGSKLEVDVVDDGFDDIDVLKLKRTWVSGTSTDRAHGILFSDTNSRMATIYADRTNSGANYNSQLLFSVNSGASGTSMITPMVINNLGRVGIGTISPDYKLDVEGDISLVGGGENYAIMSPISQGMQIAVGDPADIAVPLVTFDGDQKVGIGTTTPSAKLDVQGTQGQLFSVTDDLSGDIFSVADISGVPIMNVNSDGTSYFDGSVGIGTTSPDYKLDVNGDVGINGYIYHNGDDSRIGFEGNDAIRMYTANSVRLQINSNGNVGIGTTSPSAGSKLEVIGKGDQLGSTGFYVNSSFKDDTNVGVFICHDDTVNTTGAIAGINQLSFITYGGTSPAWGERMKITGAGDVGIGTTFPSYKLDVWGDGIALGSAAFAKYDSSNDLFLIGDWDGAGADTAIYDGNSAEVIRVTSGNVGIGTTNPQRLLSISNNDAATTPQLLITQNGSGDAVIGFNRPGYQGWAIGIDSSIGNNFEIHNSSGGVDSSSQLAITPTGNVGIGTTSPNEKLTVAGNIHTYAPSGIDAGLFASTAAGSTTIALRSNGITHFNGGDVGIGTTSPNSKLDVISGTNNGIRISATDTTNVWRDIEIRSYVSQAQADALPDGSAIYTTNPTSQTETAFSKYGGLVLQGRDNGNSSFAIRLGNGNGYATRMFMGATGVTTFSNTVTATNFILSSDERLKENVKKVRDNRIEADWKTFELKTEKGQKRYGVIAQDLEKTNPEFVREDSQGFKSVAYIDLLIAKIAELEARLEKLEK